MPGRSDGEHSDQGRGSGGSVGGSAAAVDDVPEPGSRPASMTSVLGLRDIHKVYGATVAGSRAGPGPGGGPGHSAGGGGGARGKSGALIAAGGGAAPGG